jgi:hypothetical protein
MSDFYKKASATSFLAHFDSFLLLSDASDSEKEQKLREVYAYGKANSSYANQVGFGMKLYEHLDRLGRYDEAKELLEELCRSPTAPVMDTTSPESQGHCMKMPDRGATLRKH